MQFEMDLDRWATIGGFAVPANAAFFWIIIQFIDQFISNIEIQILNLDICIRVLLAYAPK
jgi:hypothetical protein